MWGVTQLSVTDVIAISSSSNRGIEDTRSVNQPLRKLPEGPISKSQLALSNVHKGVRQLFQEKEVSIRDYSNDYRTTISNVRSADTILEYVILDANMRLFDQISDRVEDIGLIPGRLVKLLPRGAEERDDTHVYDYL